MLPFWAVAKVLVLQSKCILCPRLQPSSDKFQPFIQTYVFTNTLNSTSHPILNQQPLHIKL
jgi:hypothetical protein